MRPNSRGSIVPGTSSGQVPSTGSVRPGSGRNRLTTSSKINASPGTQAGQGLALSTAVNVSDRPVTGQGMKGMKPTTASGTGRLVEDSAYYIGILRKRVNEIVIETNKLRQEIETSNKENSQYGQLERKYEALLKNKETLEGQLADYNLALDKTRTSTDPDDVRHLAGHLKEKNAQAGQELDRIFMLKKQKENETSEIEEKIESYFKSIRSRIDNELEPGKRRAYNDLLNRQRDLQDKNINLENKLNEINGRIRQLESDDKSGSLRKEYASIEKTIQGLRKDADYLQQELDIANLEPKEAHAKFVARVNDFKKTTKDYEEKINLLKEEISNDKKTLEDLNSNMTEDTGEAAKYELLVKRDQEMTAFIDQFEETRDNMLSDQSKSKELIVALLEHLSKNLEDSSNLPTQEVFGEMEEAKTFKEKNLLTAQKTMENLQIERLKREEELNLLKQSEPKLRNELNNIKETISRMKREMREFQDIDGLRAAFEATQADLQFQKQSYQNRKESIRQQVIALQSEHESIKKKLESSEVAKELEETERRLKHNERTIFELREFIESKSRETDFETVKNNCIKITDSINAIVIKSCQGGGVFSNQAKCNLMASQDSNSNSSTNNPTNVYWGWWENAQNHALQIASKAQVIAEQATKIAQEKATILAHQAQNYDFESASTALIETLGGHQVDQRNAPKPVDTRIRGAAKVKLDLIYITENIVSMAFPCDTTQRNGSAPTSGNDIRAVSLFLKRRHSGHFMIWNVSEEGYDYSLFGDQVLEYKFPGHPAPPLGLLFKICTSVESWLDADEKNIAVAHCLTGKGRTATLLACVMTWIGEFSSPVEALQYIAERKGISVEYLTIPSQRRYLQYFSNMLDGVKPRSEPLLLRRIIISTIPVFGDNDGGEDNEGCCPYIQLFKCGKLIATAAPTINEVYNQNTSASKLQLKWVKASEGSVSFSVDCAVQGDLLLRCRHADNNGVRVSMFRAAFHTGYVPVGVLRLTKAQLDGASADGRFEDDFFIDLIFAPIEKASTNPSNPSSGATSTGDSTAPNDAGLVIDASSADRYEMSLHRDSRFWDAVSARKSRSKKRRSRKFVSSSQDQFSISDDIGLGLADELNEINFGSTANDNSSNSINRNVLSDQDLILQLAMAQDEPVRPISSNTSNSSKENVTSQNETGSSKASTTTSTPVIAGANVELQALEDLERELGLGDLNLFKSTSTTSTIGTTSITSSKVSTTATPSLTATIPTTTTDEDNLDELEKYLESLNT